MVINNATIQRTATLTSSEPTRRKIALGATAVLVAAVALITFVQSSGGATVRPTPQPASESRDEIVQDLVNRGLVPSPTRQAAPPSRDEIVQDLVNRGLVPSPTRQAAPPSRDEIVQDLVNRGLVPAATTNE